MFCKKCGTKIDGIKKFCTNCGNVILNEKDKEKETIAHVKTINHSPLPKEPWTTKRALKVLGIVAVVGIIIFYKIQNAADTTAIDKNNTALNSLDSGNHTQAIAQLQDASSNAATNDTKINTLKNLAYAYESDGKNDEALSSFQEALKLVDQNSFDHYLISAEIALLQKNSNSAYVNFKKALGIKPDDYQVNNSLALFYMNLDGYSAEYEDYSKALTCALKASSLSDSVVAKINLGVAYFYNKNYDQSIAVLSLVNITQHPDVGFYLGYDYVIKGDTSNAKSYFQQAINAGGVAPQEVTNYLNSN